MIFQSYYYDYNPLGSLLGYVIGFGINILIAILIYNDAKKRGMEPIGYVLLNCFCGCCCGGIVYLIASSNHPYQVEHQQPSFRSSQGTDTIYGQPQTTYGQPQYQQPRQPPQPRPETQTTMPDVHMVFCPICGSQNQKNAKYCSHCGADLN